MNKILFALVGVPLGLITAATAMVASGCSSQSCPAVPLHCACPTAVNGGDPVCINGSWVCQCIDAGADAGADAATD